MSRPIATSPASGTGLAGCMQRICGLHERATAQVQPFFLLALRALFGYALFLTGKGKLANLDGVAGFFASLGIPAAKLNAAAVGGIEMIGGILLIVGLASRAVSLLLVGVLGVAIATAHSAEAGVLFSEPGTFISAAPVPYLVAVVAIVLAGPGRFSLDQLISSRLRN